MATQREQSRKEWLTSNNTIEEINSGCFQRIADASEKMAHNFVSLCNERDVWKRRYEAEQVANNNFRKYITVKDRQIAALRGVVTRLKNQLTQKQAEALEVERV